MRAVALAFVLGCLLVPRGAGAQCEVPSSERRTCERLRDETRRSACLHYARGAALASDDCGETADAIAELRASYDDYPQWVVAHELLRLLRADDDLIVDELAVIERVLAARGPHPVIEHDLLDRWRNELTSFQRAASAPVQARLRTILASL